MLRLGFPVARILDQGIYQGFTYFIEEQFERVIRAHKAATRLPDLANLSLLPLLDI